MEKTLSPSDQPRRLDPRFLQASILLGYTVVATAVFHSERPHWYSISCVLWAMVLDV